MLVLQTCHKAHPVWAVMTASIALIPGRAGGHSYAGDGAEQGVGPVVTFAARSQSLLAPNQ